MQAGHAVGVAAGDLLAVGALDLGGRRVGAHAEQGGGLGGGARHGDGIGRGRRGHGAGAGALRALGGHHRPLLGEGGALLDQALALLGDLLGQAHEPPVARRGVLAQGAQHDLGVERHRARRRERPIRARTRRGARRR